MIYKRNATFPYPLLTNESTAYQNNIFEFNCDLDFENGYYIFDIQYDIGSEFIIELLNSKKASLLFIIDSTDSHFFELNYAKGIKTVKQLVSETVISMQKNTNLQLILKANEDIYFSQNNDLINFYETYKDNIYVKKGSALGFSNVLSFNGTMKNPLQLFNKRIDPNILSDVAFELNDEFITIIYRNKDFEFNDLPNARNLNNMYLYIGLYKALDQFIKNHLHDNILLSDIVIGESDSNLDAKLLMLMQSKKVKYLDENNIDEVIKKITDNLIEKYNAAVRSLTNGN